MINLLLSDSNYKHIFHPTDNLWAAYRRSRRRGRRIVAEKLISTTQTKSCRMSVGDQLISMVEYEKLM